jgi:glycosyltransferase involved in cell wall biosynthesis
MPHMSQMISRGFDGSGDIWIFHMAKAVRCCSIGRTAITCSVVLRRAVMENETDPLLGTDARASPMRLVVTSPYRYVSTRDGHAWSRTMFARSFWERYLSVFDHVCVVARVRAIDAENPPAGWSRADGDQIELARLPSFAGPQQYLLKLPLIRAALRGLVKRGDAVLARAPSRETNLVLSALPDRSYPFGLEIVADPHDVFGPGGVLHPGRPIFRWWDRQKLRRQCGTACATAYVTEGALQRRYPPAAGSYSVGCSDVELAEDAFVAAPRFASARRGPFKLLAIGSLEQMYKGMDVLIDAMAEVIRRGCDAQLRIVGDGKHHEDLTRRAERRGVAALVTFVGELPFGEPVRRELDAADLFVLPSRAEGLPRALVEAMARALPCVGTRVGGIPELLDPDYLVPAGDAAQLAEKLIEKLSRPESLALASARNLIKARAYHDDNLTSRRRHFYEELRSRTAAWLERTEQ